MDVTEPEPHSWYHDSQLDEVSAVTVFWVVLFFSQGATGIPGFPGLQGEPGLKGEKVSDLLISWHVDLNESWVKCEYFVCELTVKSEITGNHNTCPSGGSWRRTTRPAGPSWTCRCTSVFHVPGRLLSRLCVLFSWSQKNHLSPSLQFRWRLCQTEQKSFTLLLFCSRGGSISDNLNPFRLIHLWTLFLLQSPLCRSRRITLFFFF